MTIICYKDGVLAADRWVVCDGVIVGTTEKIFRTRKGVLIGASGHLDLCEAFVAWAKNYDFERFPAPCFPDAPKDGKGLCGLVILPTGGAIEYESEGRPIVGVRNDFRALGSAHDMAMAAMDAGASAREAVEVCARRRVGIGGGVTVLYLDDRRQMAHEMVSLPTSIDGSTALTQPGTIQFPYVTSDALAAFLRNAA